MIDELDVYMPLYKANFPMLADKEFGKALLPAFDRAKVEKIMAAEEKGSSSGFLSKLLKK